MGATVRLGRIAGVRVGAHWSVLGIMLILIFGLGSGVFPAQFDGYPAGAYYGAAVATSLVFLLSLLIHEVAHSVVAQRNGIGVEDITLWLLGGVSRLRGEAGTPGAEFRIAGVGPLASLVLGAFFALATWIVILAGDAGLLAGALAYLAAVNVLLAVFNLVPAAPLDGGRVLRAALWKWHGDRARAAVTAARAGRALGFILMLGGVVELIRGGWDGLWWILLGLFLVTIAGAEEQQVRVGRALSGLSVRDVMTPEPTTARGDESVASFLNDVMLTRRHSSFPLVGPGGRVEGLITLNRIRALPADERATTDLRSIACPAGELTVAGPDDPVTDLVPRMNGCSDGRAVVLDHGNLVGIVTPSDISRTLAVRGVAGGRVSVNRMIGGDGRGDGSRTPN